MEITRRSPLTGRENTRNIPVTADQLIRWKDGGLIQHVMPQLSEDDREFLLSGLTPEDWQDIFNIQQTARDDMIASQNQHEETYL